MTRHRHRQIFEAVCLLTWLGACAPPDVSSPEPLKADAAQNLWVAACKNWDEWDKTGPAFQVSYNTYYVGTCGISAILIAGSDGHILIDGGTEAGGSLILANIVELDIDPSDIRILLHSHEHFDHVAGMAEIKRATGAKLYTSVPAKAVFETGETARADPQYGMHGPFPSVRVDGFVAHEEVVQLGDLSLQAIATPGHTPGALSWQWSSCQAQSCDQIVYADSLSPIGADHYKFSDHLAYLNNYRMGLADLKDVDCDLLLTPHPSASQMRQRLISGELRNPEACRQYAGSIESRLEKRLRQEVDLR